MSNQRNGSANTALDNARQDSTDIDMIDPLTGLTPQQQRAAYLLLSGRTVQQVADELCIHRSTIWNWRRLETFEAHYNGLLGDAKLNAQEALTAMYSDALETVRRVMQSENEAAALKAAMYVIERMEAVKVGDRDMREIIRAQFTRCEMDILSDMLGDADFDERGYQKRCRELGIEP